LAQAKQDYLTALRAEVKAAIEQAAKTKLEMPPQGKSETTLNYTSEGDSLQATLKTDYKINTTALSNIRSTDAVVDVLRSISASLTIDLDATVDLPSLGVEASFVKATVEAYMQNGVAYLRLSRLESDNTDIQQLAAEMQINTWQKFDFATELAAANGDQLSMYELGREMLQMNSNNGYLSVLNEFVKPDDEGIKMLQDLADLYIQDVWQNGTIFRLRSITPTEARLTFDKHNLRSLTSKHINFLIGNYDRVRGTLMHTAPFSPLTLAMPESSRDARRGLVKLRDEISKNVPEFEPLSVTVYFDNNQVGPVQLVRTWQMPETTGYDCYNTDTATGERVEDADMEYDKEYGYDCKATESLRNFHVDLFYAPNEPTSLKDDLSSLLLATRGAGDAEPATLHLDSAPSETAENITNHTLRMVWPQYSESALDAVVRLDGDLETNTETRKLTDATLNLMMSLPNDPDLTSLRASLTHQLIEAKNKLDLEVSSVPANVLQAAAHYLGNRQTNTLDFELSTELSGAASSLALQSKFESELTQPSIVVPAAALAAE
jgi:hypothetical protein